MRYVGGKVRIAKWVEDSLAPFVPESTRYLEPFVGGGAVLARMAPRFAHVEAGDAHEDLILMWQAAQSGWVPPEDVSEEEYAALREEAPSALRGFVGYGASFSGKWFGGYVGQAWDSYHGRMTKPYAQAASRSIVKDAARFKHVLFKHQSYADWRPAPGTLVYCDPPYADTTGYGAVGSFDHGQFWRTVTEWATDGATVVVSEHTAPEGWAVLAERERRHMMRATKGGQQAPRPERLFVKEAA